MENDMIAMGMEKARAEAVGLGALTVSAWAVDRIAAALPGILAATKGENAKMRGKS
jgi:hypothetical protein